MTLRLAVDDVDSKCLEFTLYHECVICCYVLWVCLHTNLFGPWGRVHSQLWFRGSTDSFLECYPSLGDQPWGTDTASWVQQNILQIPKIFKTVSYRVKDENMHNASGRVWECNNNIMKTRVDFKTIVKYFGKKTTFRVCNNTSHN